MNTRTYHRYNGKIISFAPSLRFRHLSASDNLGLLKGRLSVKAPFLMYSKSGFSIHNQFLI